MDGDDTNGSPDGRSVATSSEESTLSQPPDRTSHRQSVALRRAVRRASSPLPSAEARWTTAALFGVHLSIVRSGTGVSTEQLASALKRSPRWILAAERGELLFTSRTVGALKWALAKASVNFDPASDDGDLVKVYEELVEAPFGTRASSLRARLDPKPTDRHPVSFDPVSDDLLPIVGSVPALDRLLTIWPPILLVAMSLGLVAVSAGRGLSGFFDSFEVEDAVATIAMVGATVLIIPLLGSCIRWLVGALRIGHMKSLSAALDEMRRVNDLPISPGHDWYQPHAADFLHPTDRSDANNAALETELAERMKLAFGFVTTFAFALSVLIRVNEGAHDTAVCGYTLFTGLLWGSAIISARRAAETVVAATFVGLGRDPSAI